MSDVAQKGGSGGAPPEMGALWYLLPDMVCEAGFDGYLRRVNRSWERVLGHREAELTAQTYLYFVHPEDVSSTAVALDHLACGETAQAFVNRYRCADGTYVALSWNAVAEPVRQAILATARPVAPEPFNANTASRLAAAFEQASEAILITDRHGVILYCNPAFEAASGYRSHECVGRTTGLLRSGLHGPDLPDRLEEAARRGEPWSGQITNRRRDGSVYVAKVSIAPIRDRSGTVGEYVCLQQDITAELELQQRLARSRALTTAGELVLGVSHDFRNLLACVRAFANLVEDTAPPGQPLLEALADLRRVTDHGGDLVQQLIDFVRQDSAAAQWVDVNALVRDVGRILRRMLPPAIELRVEPSPEPTRTWAVRARLQQVLLNLAVNARDAMPRGGVLGITIGPLEFGLAGGPFVTLAVSDTGCGMTAEVTQRIFDPFFTTKQDRGGSGVGLSNVAEIVAETNGRIEVESEPGRGTQFRIRLPADPAD